VQRVVARGGEESVRGDHGPGVVVLGGDLDVGEAVLLEQRALPQRGFGQRFGGCAAPDSYFADVDLPGAPPRRERTDSLRVGRRGGESGQGGERKVDDRHHVLLT
jgi:hypothetical protein